jgi:DNA polymerase family B, exonuclease domain
MKIAPSRPGFVPDPGTDEVVAAFYSFQDSDVASADNPSTLYQSGIVTVENEQLDPNRLRDLRLDAVPSELELLNRIIDLVVDLDPDIIVGWETQSASWGYLSARGKHYGLLSLASGFSNPNIFSGYDVGQLLSRASGRQRHAGTSVYEATHTTTFKVIGRHVLNVWRIMRAEQSLETYTFENTAFYLLQQRFVDAFYLCIQLKIFQSSSIYIWHIDPLVSKSQSNPWYPHFKIYDAQDNYGITDVGCCRDSYQDRVRLSTLCSWMDHGLTGFPASLRASLVLTFTLS